ncbi:hypothetical protein LCGC14_1634300 [marine sediment metagenome]|uniref:Radical SAM core domain-containing protein n=1 Tax=marine sediment metagenome TaxID=412755 RepID=A0A0F9I1R7_9ZZZZ
MSQIIYETRGRAREYNELAVNLYRGCDHHCIYCWAPAATFATREKFGNPEPRKDILSKLANDAEAIRGEERPILMCFSCDPFQELDVKEQLTRGAIEILKSNGLRVSILTKGGSRAQRDFDLLESDDAFGTTLTLLDEDKSRKWEPQAASPSDRIDTIIKAHSLGIPTWVSLEPVIDPQATLDIIEATHGFVDEYKIGVMNYVKMDIDWAEFARRVVALLDKLGCRYYLKKDLRQWLQKT